MDTITIRDLRNHGGEVMERVLSGERLTVTRSGRPVAELRPLERERIDAATLVERRRHLPALDVKALRRDIDDLLDPTL